MKVNWNDDFNGRIYFDIGEMIKNWWVVNVLLFILLGDVMRVFKSIFFIYSIYCKCLKCIIIGIIFV